MKMGPPDERLDLSDYPTPIEQRDEIIRLLQAENKRLAEFAREIILEYCWNLSNPEGGSIQDLAEKLNLIEPHIATAEDVDDDFSDFGIGDTIYKFTPILQKP